MNKENNQPEVVKEDTIVSLDYTLKVDGEVVDTSEGNEPIQFIQGRGQIIPGLESELNGMAVGDSKEVVVPPSRGYGDVDEKAFANIPRKEFPSNIPLEKDIKLQLRDDEGNILDAYIVNVKEKSVRLNFNHPLAGKDLHFDVTVVDLREATEEELDHGHVHDPEHQH